MFGPRIGGPNSPSRPELRRGLDVCPIPAKGLHLRLPFQLQKLLFALDTPAVASQFAIFADHAMTGDGYCHRVGGASASHGSRGLWHADLPGYGAVGTCFS